MHICTYKNIVALVIKTFIVLILKRIAIIIFVNHLLIIKNFFQNAVVNEEAIALAHRTLQSWHNNQSIYRFFL